MKKYIIGIILMLSQISLAGHDQGGGGDPCENRFQVVRDDVAHWLLKGGPEGLKLPTGISVDFYTTEMLKNIFHSSVRCVKPGDAGYPVSVAGTPKICKFEKNGTNEAVKITCDYDGFLNKTNETDQYILVHHEFAGAAGIETPNGDVSSYVVSKQLSAYLEDQIVKRLAVKKPINAAVDSCNSIQDLRKAPIGTLCATSKGAIFEKVNRPDLGESWRDPRGSVWGDMVSQNATQRTAMSICSSLGVRLPSSGDYALGETYGIREVLPNMSIAWFYWTSTLSESKPAWSAYYFYATNGHITTGNRESQALVRCVGN